MLGAQLCLQNGDPSFAPLFPLLNKAGKEGMDIEVSDCDSRLRAINLLYTKFPDESFHIILTTGGTEKIKMQDGSIVELSRADEAAKKLHRQYGIP